MDAVQLLSQAKDGTSRYGFCVDRGNRPYMEDAVEVHSRLGDFSEVYAVYDGHGGDAAVKFAASRLSSLLHAHHGFQEEAGMGRKDGELSEAFKECFATLDREFWDLISAGGCKDALDDDFARTSFTQQGSGLSPGCVACIAVVRGQTLHVANLGDCRACLCLGEGDSPATCIELTCDHQANPEKNAAEHRRVIEEGASVWSDGYIDGRIAVSRSVGDWDWETSKKCRGLISRPDVFQHEIDGNTEFLLLASDGIFDRLTSDQAVRFVRRKLRTKQKCDPKDAAEALVGFAKKSGSSDNLSAIVVLFKELEPINESVRSAPYLFPIN
jgi:serine/threonine protein phosphatase PrpC